MIGGKERNLNAHTRDTVMTLNELSVNCSSHLTFPYKFRERTKEKDETTIARGAKPRHLLIREKNPREELRSDDRHELQNRTVDVLPFVKVFRARV